MKLRKKEIKVPMNFSVPPQEIPFSSVGKSIFMREKIHFHAYENPRSTEAHKNEDAPKPQRL